MDVIVVVDLGDKELARQFAEHFDQLNYASEVELDGEKVRLHVKTVDWERLKEERIPLYSLIEETIASIHPAGWAYVQNHGISSMIDVEIDPHELLWFHEFQASVSEGEYTWRTTEPLIVEGKGENSVEIRGTDFFAVEDPYIIDQILYVIQAFYEDDPEYEVERGERMDSSDVLIVRWVGKNEDD